MSSEELDHEYDGSSVKIDESDIPQELIKQPDLFWDAAKHLAAARKQVADRKANLDLVSAEVSSMIRAKPDAYGLSKATEGAVGEALIQTEKYKKAIRLLNEAKYAQDMYQALVDALEHKKKSLESLTYLLGQNFFSAPKAGSGDPELKAMGDRAKERKKVK